MASNLLLFVGSTLSKLTPLLTEVQSRDRLVKSQVGNFSWGVDHDYYIVLLLKSLIISGANGTDYTMIHKLCTGSQSVL